MYVEGQLEGPLEQGDVCVGVPLPIVVDNMQAAVAGASTAIPAVDALENPKLLAFAVRPLIGPVLVLSQSCDLARAEGKENARILVAAITRDDESSVFAAFKEGLDRAASDDVVAKLFTAPPGQNLPKELKKTIESPDKQRLDMLKKVWLGEVEGAFPLARIDRGATILLQRSICHFDHAVTLSGAWLPVLKRKRVARLNHVWLQVLQEQLRSWLGRYAYPGETQDRWMVGLADELAKPDLAKDQAKSASTKDAEFAMVAEGTAAASHPSADTKGE